jgi:glycosyltransferase involved in cell wall biosynthesis
VIKTFTTRAPQADLRRGNHPLIIVSHAGKQHSYRHAANLQAAGHLAKFITSGYYKREAWPDCMFQFFTTLDRFMRRRYHSGIDSARIVRRPGLEVPELLARLLLRNGSLNDNLVYIRDKRFDHWVAKNWAGCADIFWGHQGSCLQSLRAAKKAGSLAVVEFTTGHVPSAVEILTRERDKHPEWADSIGNLYFADWYRHRLEQEPHEADFCIVASSFTRRSLTQIGVSDSRIRLLPLGAALQEFRYSPRSAQGPFRILFVGGVGQRKGIKYLLEAFSTLRIPRTELILAGPLMGSGKALKAYRGKIKMLGRIDQSEVARWMHRCHVLVLPSLFEGFGLVIPEAMATGLPVIASTHTVGPELIEDGREGFILEPEDTEGLATKLDWLASHRTEAVEMGNRAAERAQVFSWDMHRLRLGQIIHDIWKPAPGGARPLEHDVCP